MRVWERGSGETLACGTGACAVCVAGVLTGRTDRKILAHLPGGDLELEWAADNHVYMTGPAVEVFRGEWNEGLRISDRRSRCSRLRLRTADCPTAHCRLPTMKIEQPLPEQTRRPAGLGGRALVDEHARLQGRLLRSGRSTRSFPSATARRSTSSGTSTSCSRSTCAGTATWRCCLSRHRDAEILSHAAHHLGFEFVRGSTNRGGVAALRELLAKSRTMHLTITPDGPRGPRRQLAPGCVYLASKLGLPLVVMGYGYDRPWRVRSAWDQFAIPRPYSPRPRRRQRRDLRPAQPRPRRPRTLPPEDRTAAEPPDRRSRSLGRIRHAASSGKAVSNAAARGRGT